jgi:hypothetical protein
VGDAHLFFFFFVCVLVVSSILSGEERISNMRISPISKIEKKRLFFIFFFFFFLLNEVQGPARKEKEEVKHQLFDCIIFFIYGRILCVCVCELIV